MSIQSVADGFFPNTPWTGGSNIHVSLAISGVLQSDNADPHYIIALLVKVKLGEQIWDLLQKNFSSMTWELSKAEFTKLFLVDCIHHLRGEPDTESEGKLTNPITGNRFHRMAMLGEYVAGVRFWCDPNGYDLSAVDIGFRFRFEKLDENADEVRLRLRRIMEEVETEFETINEVMFDLAEPSKAQVAEAKQLVKEFA